MSSLFNMKSQKNAAFINTEEHRMDCIKYLPPTLLRGMVRNYFFLLLLTSLYIGGI